MKEEDGEEQEDMCAWQLCEDWIPFSNKGEINNLIRHRETKLWKEKDNERFAVSNTVRQTKTHNVVSMPLLLASILYLEQITEHLLLLN